MIEFEKWWDEVLDMHWSHYDQGVCYCAWKAALEWALEQDTWIGPDECGEWGIDKYAIKEELNAKT